MYEFGLKTVIESLKNDFCLKYILGDSAERDIHQFQSDKASI